MTRKATWIPIEKNKETKMTNEGIATVFYENRSWRWISFPNDNIKHKTYSGKAISLSSAKKLAGQRLNGYKIK